MKLLRWLRTLAVETASNPLVWEGRPWRRTGGLAWAVLVIAVGAALGATLAGLLFLAMFPLVTQVDDTYFRIESVVLCFSFLLPFYALSRDWRRGDRLIELSLTRLSAREVVIGSIFWGVVGGVLAVLLAHGVAMYVLTGVEGTSPKVIWGSSRVSQALDWRNAFVACAVIGTIKLWPIVVFAAIVSLGWLARPGWLGGLWAFLRGMGAVILLSSTSLMVSSYGQDVFGLQTFGSSVRGFWGASLQVPWLEFLLLAGLPVIALAAIGRAGPPAYLAGTETAFNTSSGWRWLVREGRFEPERLKNAKKRIRPHLIAFWKDIWGAGAISLLLTFLASVWIFAPGPFRLALAPSLPFAAGVTAAVTLTVWSRVKAGGTLHMAPALGGWAMRRYFLPVFAIGAALNLMVLSLLRGLMQGDSVARSFSYFLENSYLLVLCIPWLGLVFLLGAAGMRGWRGLTLAWGIPGVVALLGILLRGAGFDGSLITLPTPLPFGDEIVVVSVFTVRQSYWILWDGFGTAAFTAAFVIFAAYCAGLREILMQRFYDKELAGLGLFEISGDGEAKSRE